MYEFVGKLMGVAIRTNNTLELDLPSIVWKPLVGQELEIGDLTAIDQMAVQAMNLICDEKAMAEKGIDASNFEDVYGFDFTYSSCDGTLVELVENGADHAVTWQNRTEYARLVLEYRLYELNTQVRALRAGLISVIPARFLSLLTWKVSQQTPARGHPRSKGTHASVRVVSSWFVGFLLVRLLCASQELELEICGSPEIDIEHLKANTTYSGCSPHDLHIKHFWTVLTAFSQLERGQFLRFAWSDDAITAQSGSGVASVVPSRSLTFCSVVCSCVARVCRGRSRLPQGSKFTDKMRIDSTGMDVTHLPQAHTCFFSIELPKVRTTLARAVRCDDQLSLI